MAGAFADTVDNIEDPNKVYIELQLMEPSWFGFLVGNIFLEKKRNMKISKLADLSQKFFQLSDRNSWNMSMGLHRGMLISMDDTNQLFQIENEF